MDIELTSEQIQLQDSARRMLEKSAPPRAVFQMEQDPAGYSAAVWTEMAELGWMGLPFPEEYGGSDMHTVDIAVLAKEMGRVQLPSPYIPTVLLAGKVLEMAGSEDQKRRYLPRIIEGELILGFAMQEKGGTYDARHVATTATALPDGFVLNGEKRFVEYAAQAEKLVVVARSSAATSSWKDGLSLYLVDPKAQGVTITPLQTFARDRQCHVKLDNVKLGRDALIGASGKAWAALEPVIQRAVVAFSAMMVGGTERAMELATDYSKQRMQFGKLIGSFMSIQHYLAQIAMEVTAADTLVQFAAWHLDMNRPSRALVARAKLGAAGTFQAASLQASMIYGGMGYVDDVDITLYLRRGKQWQLCMGDADYWERVLAEEVLDRPSRLDAAAA